jgi:hypothetical protein
VVIDHGGGGLYDDGRDAKSCVSTAQPTSPPPPSSYKPPLSPHDDSPKNKFGPQSKNLASIIRGYKTGVTKSARKIYPDFKWQPRYHDHIIRDNQAFHRISKYILDKSAELEAGGFFVTQIKT